jgi:hypothetical protein
MKERSRSSKQQRPRSQPRATRPNLARSQPVRLFGGIFGVPPAATNGSPPVVATNVSRAAAAMRGSSRQAADRGKETRPTNDDSVGRGVNAGYRVIEEYLRQGQELARSVWPGARSTSSEGVQPLNLTERMLRSASDLAGLFSEFLQTFSLPGSLPPPGSQPLAGFGVSAAERAQRPASATGPSRPSRPSPSQVAPSSEADRNEGPAPLSIEVDSKRRTEVTVNLNAGSWKTKLEVHDLRSTNRAAPPLGGIEILSLPTQRRLLIRVRIPDRQASGTYSGLVVDQKTNVPRGTLSIRILASDKKR